MSDRLADGAGHHERAGAESWLGLCDGALPVEAVTRWVKVPSCGAIVTFCGCVRDHSPGRPEVSSLEYEAYEGPAVRRMEEIVISARARWSLGRVAMVHRTGLLAVSEDAVVVAVSSAHRTEAFEAARFCIDALKASVPIWKHECWRGGQGWGICAHQLDDITA